MRLHFARLHRRSLRVAMLLGFLAALALLVGGCNPYILSGVLPPGQEAGPSYPITVQVWPGPSTASVLRLLAAANPERGVLAIRMPVGWEVDTAWWAPTSDLTSRHPIHSSHAISDYFTNTWNNEPLDAGHTGIKPGYWWWAGYSDVVDAAQDAASVTVLVDTHGIAGSFSLDLVGGVADPTSPENPASNQGGAAWEMGSTANQPAVQLGVPAVVAALSIPRVIASNPLPGATGVPVDIAPTLTFSEAMDPPSVAKWGVYLQKLGGLRVQATATYDAGTRTVTLQPKAPLAPATDYQLVADGTLVTDAAYNPMSASYAVLFRTVGGSADWPTVSALTPLAQATDVASTSIVSATFSEAMNPSTVTAAAFTLSKVRSSTLVPATVTYDAASRTATLDPAADLDAGAQYMASLLPTITAATGTPLPGNTTWTFTIRSTATNFSDVHPGGLYYTAIQGMAARGIINGFSDGTFRPNDPVIRQQFAKMIVKTLGIAVTGTEVCSFADVSASPTGADPFYPAKYVAACAARGITVGTTPTTFAPGKNITREQLITMVVRAAGLADPPASYVAPFSATQFSLQEHYQNACKAAYAGLLDGLLGVGAGYDFSSTASRGECAQILWNLLQSGQS